MNAGDVMDVLSRSLFDGLQTRPPINWAVPSNLNAALVRKRQCAAVFVGNAATCARQDNALRQCSYERDTYSQRLQFTVADPADSAKGDAVRARALRGLGPARR
jgi:hypothetical protein